MLIDALPPKKNGTLKVRAVCPNLLSHGDAIARHALGFGLPNDFEVGLDRGQLCL